MQKFAKDVVIVGGCGHVGLPLGLALADAGLLGASATTATPRAVDQVRAGKMPFFETRRRRAARAGARDRTGSRRATDPDVGGRGRARRRRRRHAGRRAPQPRSEVRAAARSRSMLDQLRDGQLLVLRSTVYPGVTAMVERLLARLGPRRSTSSFCPERIAEGKALEELRDAAADRVRPHRARRCERADDAVPAISPTRSSTSTSRKPSSPSCSRTRGATSSSRPRTSST